MKAKVIKAYRDRQTGAVNKIGQEVEVTKERFKEINSAALGPFLERLTDQGVKGELLNKPETKPDPEQVIE